MCGRILIEPKLSSDGKRIAEAVSKFDMLSTTGADYQAVCLSIYHKRTVCK